MEREISEQQWKDFIDLAASAIENIPDDTLIQDVAIALKVQDRYIVSLKTLVFNL